jgi:hypothetical protein
VKQKVYLLWHTYETERTWDEKLVGVYSTRANAHDAYERLRDKDGFAEFPDLIEWDADPRNGFVIEESDVDREGMWGEGFAHD